MIDTGSIFLKIPSDKFFLGLVRKVIADFAERVGFNEIEIAKIEMAVDEACANVINHSYKEKENVSFSNRDNDIEINISVNEEKITIDILDKGTFFDFHKHFNKVLNIEAHLKKMHVQGLGMYIIKNFMDKVSFTRTDDGYNKLRMVKLLKTASH